MLDERVGVCELQIPVRAELVEALRGVSATGDERVETMVTAKYWRCKH
jgi:hypothetical protein